MASFSIEVDDSGEAVRVRVCAKEINRIDEKLGIEDHHQVIDLLFRNIDFVFSQFGILLPPVNVEANGCYKIDTSGEAN